MTSEELYTLDNYIKEDRSFAIYRLPGEDTLHFVEQTTGTPTLLHSIHELNGQEGFVVAPFRVSEKTPIVLLACARGTHSLSLAEHTRCRSRNKEQGTKEQESLSYPTSVSECVPCSASDSECAPRAQRVCSASYSEHFQTFITPIREKKFKKLVLSRSVCVERDAAFSPVQAFLLACREYTRSYVYLCHTPQTGTWLGGTPEMLLSGKGNVWNTVAIAGTQPLQNGELPKTWDDKNLIEQMLVAYYIRTQLTSFGIHPSEKGPYTVRAGRLAHLRSDFMFALEDTRQLGDLLKLLHPTPAVSGLPKEEAYRFINEYEGYDRRYYSGFVGWLAPKEKSDLYVNLRCMNIHADSFTLYAGGGLLPSSDREQEWHETEAKLQTMLYLTNPSHYVYK